MADGSGFCIECGEAALVTNQKFCSACGHNLELDTTADSLLMPTKSASRSPEPYGWTKPRKDEAEAGEPLLEVRNGRFEWSWRWGGPLIAATWTGILLMNVIDNPNQARTASIIGFVVVVFGGVLLSVRQSPD